MDLPENILLLFDPKAGKVFRGNYPKELEAREHSCIIITSSTKNVCYVFMTSKKNTIDFLHRDDEKGFVELGTDFSSKYFNHPQITYISCHKNKIKTIPKEEIIKGLQDHSMHLQDDVDIDVLYKIYEAIKETKTLQDEDKEQILKGTGYPYETE
ncbi:MAG: hypothetical protein LBT84_03595 [Spirochaetia bacterium]|jgi:hypothetical protein|nr:hypothetical protein [Spirochaetia bacterium]